jgi:hypothetical protein
LKLKKSIKNRGRAKKLEGGGGIWALGGWDMNVQGVSYHCLKCIRLY